MVAQHGFSSVADALEAIARGGMVIVADDEDRENEGDLVCAAEAVTPELINFMAMEARGLICMPISREIAARLQLEPMQSNQLDKNQTAFTVSVDGLESMGVSTGISAADRANTIRICVDDTSGPNHLRRPGHVFPLVAKDGGVLERTGQTEAAVDLARLSGYQPAGVICEIVRDDGTMARRDDLMEFSARYGIPFITVRQIMDYRLQHELLVSKQAEANMPTARGKFDLHAYTENITGKEHLALTYGNWRQAEAPIVRLHSECLTGDVFGSLRCDCHEQLQGALAQIEEAGAGILLYLRQEGRGIGLVNKIKAYDLQDREGLDTYEANRKLGFEEDLRQYWVAAHMLRDLGVTTVSLLTNNPDKVNDLVTMGIQVSERLPLVHICEENRRYVEIKSLKRNHSIV